MNPHPFAPARAPFFLLLSLFLGITSLVPEVSFAGTSRTDQQQQSRSMDAAGGGGGEVPTPFSINRHFELADQELYVLSGKVVILSETEVNPKSPNAYQAPRAYLQINLEHSPWLANDRRVRRPYYRLKGSYLEYVRACSKKVTHLFRAHGLIENQAYLIELEPITLKD